MSSRFKCDVCGKMVSYGEIWHWWGAMPARKMRQGCWECATKLLGRRKAEGVTP